MPQPMPALPRRPREIAAGNSVMVVLTKTFGSRRASRKGETGDGWLRVRAWLSLSDCK